MFVKTIFMEDISSVHRAMNGVIEGERLTGRAVELYRVGTIRAYVCEHHFHGGHFQCP